MADIKRVFLPGLAPQQAFGATNFTLNQTTDQAEWIFKAADAITITRLGFRVGTLNGTATTWKISLQGVDGSNGYPDGTIKGGGSPASVTFTNSGLAAAGWYWFTLANPYTCAKSDDLAMVVAYDSGTSPSAGVNDLAPTMSSAVASPSLNPYSIQNDNGSRTKSSPTPCFGYGSSGKAYGLPAKADYTQALTSSSNPSELAMKFTLPAGSCTNYKVAGVRAFVGANAGAILTFRLYDGTTVLQDVTADSDMVQGTSYRPITIYFDETTLATLTPGTAYRIAMATSTASSQYWRGFSVDSAADWDGWPGGQDFGLSTRNGGAWTDVPETRLMGDLILDDLTAISSSTYVFNIQG